MRIWKYPLKITDKQVIELPYNSTILTAQMQGDELQLWALVNDETTLKSKHKITIYGTGHPMPDFPGEYVSTFQMGNGELVFHVFNSWI